MTKKLVFSIIILSIFFVVHVKASENRIPEAIKVPDGNNAYLTVHAKGAQIFHCALKADAYSWKWHAPEAKLYDMQNQDLIGSHDVGPSWTYKDGSSIAAKAVQKIDAPDKDSAQWLLLEVIKQQKAGLLAQTSFVQRINTQGGIPPTAGCDANHIGSEKRVGYSADYIFYKK